MVVSTCMLPVPYSPCVEIGDGGMRPTYNYVDVVVCAKEFPVLHPRQAALCCMTCWDTHALFVMTLHW